MYCPECEKETAVKVYRYTDIFGRILELEIYLCKECDWVSVNDWWWSTEEE